MAAKPRRELIAEADPDAPGTRARILAAAWKIVSEKGEPEATIKVIAKIAKISRQAVYLHFSDRSELLLALSQYVDEKIGLGSWRQEIETLRDGETMLRRIAETRAQRSKIVAPLLRRVEADRFRDESAAAAWKRLHEMNTTWMETVVVTRLKAEDRVHPSWNINEAASLLITLFSFRTWDDLAQARGWPVKRYVEILTAASLSILAGPSTRDEDGAVKAASKNGPAAVRNGSRSTR